MNMNQNNKTLTYFACIVLAVVAVLAAGYYFGAQAEKTKAAASRAALVKEIFSPVLSIANVFGKITEISSDKKSFVIEVPNMFQVNLPAEYRRKHIAIVSETKVVLFEQKDSDVLAKEMEEFRKKQIGAKGVSSAGNPPIPVVEKEINSDGLRVDDMVSVIFSPESGKTFFDNELAAVHISVNR